MSDQNTRPPRERQSSLQRAVAEGKAAAVAAPSAPAPEQSKEAAAPADDVDSLRRQLATANAAKALLEGKVQALREERDELMAAPAPAPVPEPVSRGDLRQEMRAEPRHEVRPASFRDDDPRDRAARRAAEILGLLTEDDLEGTDEFHIDPAIVPTDWTYEWKRVTCFNQEDPAYQVKLARGGWEPVPADRHPEMMPSKGSFEIIERDGMVLMERPAVVTQKIREMEKKRSRDQVRQKEAQLAQVADGQFARVDAQGRSTVKLSKTYSPLEVPSDA